MKLGRNNLCLCGSGKKYKKCCLQKKVDDEVYPEEKGGFKRLFLEMNKAKRIKLCMHPNKSKCSKSIIDAHSLQNNGILSRLAIGGEVLMFKLGTFEKGGIPFGLTEIHKNSATTFKGFCNHHDTELFSKIENEEFKGEEEQIFLYAYRAFCSKYYDSLIEQKGYRDLFKRKPNMISNEKWLISEIQGVDLRIKDMESIKKEFDISIMNRDFDILKTVMIEVDYEILFACTSSFTPIFDLQGKIINEIFSIESERLKALYLTCIPMENKSVILLSCLKTDLEILNDFINQIEIENKEMQKRIISNMTCAYIENLVVSKKLLNDVFTSKEVAAFGDMYEATNNIVIPKELISDLRRDNGFNLFKRLNL